MQISSTGRKNQSAAAQPRNRPTRNTMIALFVAVAADSSLSERIRANQAAEVKLQAVIEAQARAQAALASSPNDTQALMELVKANRAVEATMARFEEQAAQISELTRQTDALRQPRAAAVTAAGQQVLEQAQRYEQRLSELSASSRRPLTGGL